jgi:hypothetical protein
LSPDDTFFSKDDDPDEPYGLSVDLLLNRKRKLEIRMLQKTREREPDEEQVKKLNEVAQSFKPPKLFNTIPMLSGTFLFRNRTQIDFSQRINIQRKGAANQVSYYLSFQNRNYRASRPSRSEQERAEKEESKRKRVVMEIENEMS